jgi:hypothetical protein
MHPLGKKQKKAKKENMNSKTNTFQNENSLQIGLERKWQKLKEEAKDLEQTQKK